MMHRHVRPTLTFLIVVVGLLAFAARPASAATYPALSGTLVPVNTGASDQFDPHVSGDWVSYTDFSVSPSQIRYHNLVTGQDAAIPNGGAQDVVSGISGTKVVYMHITNGGQAINLYDIGTGSSPAELDPTANEIRADPAIGGHTVAWEDSTAAPSSADIIAYDLNTGTATNITNDAATNANARPSVSPDGSVIVWMKCPSAFICHIWQAVQSGGTWTAKQLTSGSGVEELPHTNGQIVTYDSTRTVNGVSTQEVYWQPVGGGPEHQITSAPAQARDPHVSGNLISFEMKDPTASDTSWRVYVYNLATGTTSVVPSTPNLDNVLSDISVSPDGTGRVVWMVNEPGSGYNVYGFLFSVADLSLSLAVTPSTATTGTTVTASGTLTNDAAVSRDVTVRGIFQYTGPGGRTNTLTLPTMTFTMAAGQTIQRSFSFMIRTTFPRGTYSATLTASDSTGSTTASATLTVT